MDAPEARRKRKQRLTLDEYNRLSRDTSATLLGSADTYVPRIDRDLGGAFERPQWFSLGLLRPPQQNWRS
jgi:hypothetical protein